MRVSKGRLWFSLLLLVEQVSSLRDGFRPLPIRPQDQIKGDYSNLSDIVLFVGLMDIFHGFVVS